MFTSTENTTVESWNSVLGGEERISFFPRSYPRYSTPVEYAVRSAEINNMFPCQLVSVFYQTWCRQGFVIREIKPV